MKSRLLLVVAITSALLVASSSATVMAQDPAADSVWKVSPNGKESMLKMDAPPQERASASATRFIPCTVDAVGSKMLNSRTVQSIVGAARCNEAVDWEWSLSMDPAGPGGTYGCSGYHPLDGGYSTSMPQKSCKFTAKTGRNILYYRLYVTAAYDGASALIINAKQYLDCPSSGSCRFVKA